MMLIRESLLENSFIYRGVRERGGKIGDILTFDSLDNKENNEHNWPKLNFFYNFIKNKINKYIPDRSLCAYFSGDIDYARSYGWGKNSILCKLIDFRGSAWFNKDIDDFVTHPYFAFSVENLSEKELNFVLENIFDYEKLIKYKFSQNSSNKELIKFIKWLKAYFSNLEEYKIGDKTYNCEYIVYGKYIMKIIELKTSKK